MRNRTLKKNGGFNWKRDGSINKILQNVQFDIDSRCKRKIDNISRVCTQTNLYHNITESIRINPDTSLPYFYYVPPNKRQFIFERSTWTDSGLNKLDTKSTNFPYYYILVKKDGGKLVAYNNKNITNDDGVFSIPCDMFGLIPNDVKFSQLFFLVNNRPEVEILAHIRDDSSVNELIHVSQ